MARIYGNFHEGTLTSGITDVATSIVVTWAANASEPADFSSGTMTLVIDPEGAEHPPEVVLASAYVGATNTFTVTRAQEGSTAQAFDSGRKIVAVVSKAALDEFLTTNTAQTITGAKTFSSAITANGGVAGDVTGNVTGNVTGTAGIATTVTLTDTSDTTCFPLIATDATGDKNVKTDAAQLTYNASTGALSAVYLAGTLTTAAQGNITSLGTLTGLSVSGNITVTGNVDGRDVSADGTKLDGIESGATADQTAADIRALGFFDTSNDGSGSGLDADKVDGLQASQFLRSDASDSTSGTLTISNSTKALDLTGSNPKIYFDSSSYIEYRDSDSALRIILDGGEYWRFDNGGHWASTAILPDPTATQNLGSSSYRWLSIYSANPVDVSSDATMKNVSDIEAPGMEFIRLLRSTEWEWADKSWGEGNRWGPTAQNIRDALAKIGRKSSMVSGEEGNLSVRFNDLLGSFINALKELDARIQALEV